ncbi:nucleotidyltransferase family protein [Mangrovibacterium marinum]|uniref:Nucleotidyltransferase-like protein n=1 Tax=Mangrovibacterium marinum TaxID=1639118 RepID=A0A2T5BY93_9BACT|nr:nucleotidyltransferase family protein [Mangrovibacterium marinum]PTN06797.1 nucleotidyltransferase-like protein [Mangrovibacterium marinum]
MKAMLFAAGLGTRLKPLTDNKPKALVEIGGITLLERCINQLKENGIRDIVINIHHFGDQIKDFLKQHQNFGLSIAISDERDALLDTGGAILKAKPWLTGSEPILLINVDILTNLNFKALLDDHLRNKALATLVVRRRSTSRYLLFKEQILVGWENKKSGEIKVSRPGEIAEAEEFAFSGIHLIQPQLLDKITESGKFAIIDLYLRLARQHTIRAFVDSSSVWMDLGKISELSQAEELVRSLDAD